MKILVIDPGKAPEVRDISLDLRTMQGLVDGPIEAIYPFNDTVAVVGNEEAKLHHLQLNRYLGEIQDIMCGTFFVCGSHPYDDHFSSLSDEQIARYQNRFKHPEEFVVIGGQLIIIPIDPKRGA